MSDLLSWSFRILNKFLFGLCQFGLVILFSTGKCWFTEEKKLTLSGCGFQGWLTGQEKAPVELNFERQEGQIIQATETVYWGNCLLEGEIWDAQTPLRRASTYLSLTYLWLIPRSSSSSHTNTWSSYDAIFLHFCLGFCRCFLWCNDFSLEASWKLVSSWMEPLPSFFSLDFSWVTTALWANHYLAHITMII